MENEIKWKQITLEDKEVIDSFYRKQSSRNCEFTFANNFLWAPHYGIQYSVIGGMLVFLSDESKMSVSFPMGKGEESRGIGQVMETLFSYFREKGRPFKMHLVSPAQFQQLEQLYPGRFRIEYNRDSADYVYETEKLISLSGKRLHGKRNHINRFRDNYPDWRYESITEENTEECAQMAEAWRQANECDDKGEKHQEFCVTLNALKYRGELGLRGGLIRAGGKVMAFSLGEPCGADTFVVHIEKAYADVPGAYPIINQQFVEHEASGYHYINREEDTGDEGLRKAKLSYHPVFMMEKGLVTEYENN